MVDPSKPIVVFGATGRQGGAVATALRRAEWPVRALVRDETGAQAKHLLDAGVETIRGSFEDRDAMRRAMDGAYGVFSVLPCNLGEGEEVRFGSEVADLAVESGVEHLVYSSGASVGEQLTGIPRFDAKPRVEAHVRELPIATTIVRPVVFMDMLIRPGYGLENGRFAFFLRHDQTMQLIAVDDIGRFVAAVFADRTRFTGRTVRLAGDTVTGRDIETALSDAARRPIAYTRFPAELLADKPDLAAMSRSLEDGPLSQHVALDEMRELNPSVQSFRQWLSDTGREPLANLLGGEAPPVRAGA